jgi:hypothetical protein
MDLHGELTKLPQRLATETLGGAFVYGVREDDRSLIARPLSWDSPWPSVTCC